MSYILEALKKAESERQLGSTPGLHAAPIQASGRAKVPRWVGYVGVAITLGAVALSVARREWPAQPTPRPVAAAPAPAPVAPPAPPVVAAPSSDAPLFAPAPAQAPRAEPKPVAPPSPPAPVEKPAPEERYPLLAQVPADVARELPQVTIGGYIYAKNPAESLLLVDKTLRREGEEVAPGLVLEKLLRKSAVMNYRGYRYRVPY